jgi:hypothetical protein
MFTATVNNAQNTDVTWKINNNTGALGQIDPNQGIYTPPEVIPTPNTLTIIATSVADPNATDVVTVTLVSGNTLRFDSNISNLGINTQVTDYTFPLDPGLQAPDCSPCVAATSSSGQHSVKVFRNKSGPFINTFIYTVWSDNRNGSTTYDVFFRQITITEDTSQNPSIQTDHLSNMVKINSISSTDAADPSISVDNAGFVYVAWSSGTTTRHAVYIHKSTTNPTRNSGQQVTFTSGFDVRFSDFTNCDQRAPSIGAEGNSVLVAWQDNRITNNPSSCGSYNIRVAKGSPPALPPAPSPSPGNFPPPESFPLPFTNTTIPGDQTEPSVGLFRGQLYVAWTQAQTVNHDIYFTKGPIDAKITSTTPVRVNDDTGGADHIAPSLALDSLGYVYVAWQDSRNDSSPGTCSPCKYDIFFAKSINSGTSFDGVPTKTLTTTTTNITEHNVRVNDDTAANGFADTADHLRPSIVLENPEPNASHNTPNKIYVSWDDTRYGRQDIITAKSVDGGNSFWTNSNPANLPLGIGAAHGSSIAVDTFGRAYVFWTDERNNPDTDVFFAIGQ